VFLFHPQHDFMEGLMTSKITTILLLICASAALAVDDLQLESFDYPYEMQTARLYTQQQELEMAYAEIQAKGKKELGTVVLLHGKDFSGLYWKTTADALSVAGFRVIIPDQIGFGKSSKPKVYQYSFHQLADNTNTLLQRLGHRKVHLIGHSMGAMIAVRQALMFPTEVLSLTLINPLGLEDWKAKGMPYQSVDTLFQQQLKQTADNLRQDQTEQYYGGQWRDSYLGSIQMFETFRRSPDYSVMAWNQALTYDMIFTQPVCYEFPQISQPTLLIIGLRDRTVPGQNTVPADRQESLGNYLDLGRAAAATITKSRLVELEDLGHVPQLEDFPRFIEPVLKFLKKPSWDKKKE
jgi:pimeloyl-ACP methyl ester carboxylesterase